MMPPFVVFPTNRIAHFVEVSLYLFYLAQQVKLDEYIHWYNETRIKISLGGMSPFQYRRSLGIAI